MEENLSSNRRLSERKSNQPLLGKDNYLERGRDDFTDPVTNQTRPTIYPKSAMRSISPDGQAKLAIRKKYKYAALFLGLSLITFVVQTETAVYIQHELGWNKPFCMLYFTHGSWTLLWPIQLLISRLQKWNMPGKIFWRGHFSLLRTTAQMVETRKLTIPPAQHSPLLYMIKITALVSCALTIAGGSWYVAVSMTSPADLTAIYNCSAFFAYVFSVPILKEKLRWDKSIAVAVAIIGVLVVAYGDTVTTEHEGESVGSAGGGHEKPLNNRVAGNLIIGIGSVLYGFYEVLYKRFACPPEGTSAGRGMIFANTFGSLIGFFTLFVLWIPLIALHVTGIERFELPHGPASWVLGISVLSSAIFSGSFLVLISLTSPVLSSVAALLTIFLVAIVDWLVTGVPLSPAALLGGMLIIIAFVVLSWSTYREMSEESRKKYVEFSDDDIEDE